MCKWTKAFYTWFTKPSQSPSMLICTLSKRGESFSQRSGRTVSVPHELRGYTDHYCRPKDSFARAEAEKTREPSSNELWLWKTRRCTQILLAVVVEGDELFWQNGGYWHRTCRTNRPAHTDRFFTEGACPCLAFRSPLSASVSAPNLASRRYKQRTEPGNPLCTCRATTKAKVRCRLCSSGERSRGLYPVSTTR